ncbi:MAG: metallophosphoesterase [Proteobacteria bacterium]|nr:metallophosphoesterase [Pseudomonadota bacterium]MCL2307089.1 metallophosphoesterase [Pseudomonadota bacterium]
MNIFFIIMLAVQTTLGAYLGWRFRWAFGVMLPPRLMAWYVFWPMVALIVMSFPLVHFFSRRFGVELPSWLFFATALLYGALATGFATVVIADVLGLIVRRLPFLQTACAYVRQHPHHLGFLILGIIALQMVFGFYRAHTPRETHFSPTVHKPLRNGATQLRIVQLSDLHISRYSSVTLMQEMVARVNRLQPDIIVFTGDVIDNSAQPYFDQEMPRILGGLKSRYGVYAIMSNHDYYGESPKLNIDAYTRSNMRVLRDEILYLEEPGITLIGRDDWILETRQLPPSVLPDAPGNRASLAALTANADPATPWILLDHQPRQIDEAIAQKIDLQFSGHTHNGQFFPINLIVKHLYKKPWGLLTEGTYSLIVTCGFGTWGPPLRFPGYAEIIVADVLFQPSDL